LVWYVRQYLWFVLLSPLALPLFRQRQRGPAWIVRGLGTVKGDPDLEGSASMQVTDVISAVIVGVVIGILGRLILPGRQRIGIFVTFFIGVGAALLGALVANSFGINDRAPFSYRGVDGDWIVLAIQVGFAVAGTALAAYLSHTRIAYNERQLIRPTKTTQKPG
jgi:uncharacterized membrane protein YeaQ/YmgE (transglycosylase-associated protein family)